MWLWVPGKRALTSTETPDMARRVTLKGHPHPAGRGGAPLCRMRKQGRREGTPEEAEHNT